MFVITLFSQTTSTLSYLLPSQLGKTKVITWIDNRISSIEPPTIAEIVEAIPDEPPQILPLPDETNTPVVVTQVVVEEIVKEVTSAGWPK
jgi:hypothetical protein